jgi:hypothetical protein
MRARFAQAGKDYNRKFSSCIWLRANRAEFVDWQPR